MFDKEEKIEIYVVKKGLKEEEFLFKFEKVRWAVYFMYVYVYYVNSEKLRWNVFLNLHM
jgi:hypothetical protein